MTFPVELLVGNFSVPLHAILETIGIFAGFRFFIYHRKKYGDQIEATNRTWIILAAILGALFGSRLIGSLENPLGWLHSQNPLLYFMENKTVVGGLLGGLACVEIIKVLIAEKQSSGDLFVYPLIIAMVIGRMGCFSMGVYEETYGQSTTFIFGMNLGDGLLRHPVSLYEICFLILLGSVLKLLQNKFTLRNGALFKLYMILYLTFRFLLDYIKPHYTYPIGLSTIQLACLFGLLYYSPYVLFPRKLITEAYA